MIVKKNNSKECIIIKKTPNYYEDIIYLKYGLNINNISNIDIVENIKNKINILYSSPKKRIL
tara:strand:+ start:1250 stop:1435 length:186 start_codon:yes stop_codon:yes gene_type:complete